MLQMLNSLNCQVTNDVPYTSKVLINTYKLKVTYCIKKFYKITQGNPLAVAAMDNCATAPVVAKDSQSGDSSRVVCQCCCCCRKLF